MPDLAVDVVVHGEVGVGDVHLHVQVRDVLDPDTDSKTESNYLYQHKDH